MDAHALGDPPVGRDELEPRGPGLADLPLGDRAHDEDARVAERGAEVQASGSVATQSAVAPASSAACETSTAPCP